MLGLHDCVIELTSDTGLFLVDISKKIDSITDGSLQKQINSSLDGAQNDSMRNLSVIPKW
jgi:hypothetical protein